MTTSNDQHKDVVDLIQERHELIRHGFADVIAAEGLTKAARFDELITRLAVHEAAAQELIRPLVERQGRAARATHIGQGEQAEVMSGLSLLSSMDVEEDNFDLELIGVAREVTLHLEAQARDDLPFLRRSLPAEELHALAEVLLSAESIARADASVTQPEITSPDALGPRDVLSALGDMIRGVNRP